MIAKLGLATWEAGTPAPWATPRANWVLPTPSSPTKPMKSPGTSSLPNAAPSSKVCWGLFDSNWCSKAGALNPVTFASAPTLLPGPIEDRWQSDPLGPFAARRNHLRVHERRPQSPRPDRRLGLALEGHRKFRKGHRRCHRSPCPGFRWDSPRPLCDRLRDFSPPRHGSAEQRRWLTRATAPSRQDAA